MTGVPTQPRRRTAARLLVSAGTATVGVLLVVGCLLALRLEADGFGRPRDTGMRPGYVAALAGGSLAGLVVPAVVCTWLLDGPRRWVCAVAGGAALIAVVSVLGVLSWS